MKPWGLEQGLSTRKGEEGTWQSMDGMEGFLLNFFFLNLPLNVHVFANRSRRKEGYKSS